MELTDREKDLSEALSGTAKSALSLIPGLGQAIAGWDAYKRSSFDRNLKNTISHLKNKVDDFKSFFPMIGLVPKKANSSREKSLILLLIHKWKTSRSYL